MTPEVITTETPQMKNASSVDPVEVAPVEVAPVEVAPVEVDPMVRQLTSMTEMIQTLANTSKLLAQEMKTLTKDVNKLRISKAGKKAKRVVNPDEPRKLGALEKPVEVTEELIEFLGLTKGEMYSRHKITQEVHRYVKDHNLQNPENRRYILLDSEPGLKLKAVLRDPDQPLTFFNIQRYLKVHYPKTETTETTDPAKKGKTVDVTSAEGTDTSKTDIVADAGVVEETTTTESTEPKKKIVRKVVKKVATPSVVPATA